MSKSHINRFYSCEPTGCFFSGFRLTLVSRPLSRPFVLTLHHKSLMCHSPSHKGFRARICVVRGTSSLQNVERPTIIIYIYKSGVYLSSWGKSSASATSLLLLVFFVILLASEMSARRVMCVTGANRGTASGMRLLGVSLPPIAMAWSSLPVVILSRAGAHSKSFAVRVCRMWNSYSSTSAPKTASVPSLKV